MITTFLKAKHWQLFLLSFGIPMIFQFVMMATMFSNIGNDNLHTPSNMFDHIKLLFPIIMLLFMGVFFGWFWSIAIGLQSKVPEGVKMKVKKFKIFFFTPLIYLSLFLGLFIISMRGPNPAIFAIIIPLHLFSMFCMFYNLYFVAKTLKTVELQREVSFSDFAGEFFLIWFYPIGIWILQPKINQMIENEKI